MDNLTRVRCGHVLVLQTHGPHMLWHGFLACEREGGTSKRVEIPQTQYIDKGGKRAWEVQRQVPTGQTAEKPRRFFKSSPLTKLCPST